MRESDREGDRQTKRDSDRDRDRERGMVREGGTGRERVRERGI